MTTERGTNRDDDDEGAGYGKLIPEWGVDADDQIVFAGLAVLGFLFIGLGWSFLFGGGTEEVVVGVVTTNADLAAPTTDEDGIAVVPAPDESTTTTEASTTSEAPTTSEAAATIGDVQASVDPFPGAITGINEGSTAVLTGFVANQGESDEAEAAALQVEGIEAVDNQLQLLEGPVHESLVTSGVKGASVSGVGTVMTVSGTIDSEDARQPTLDAAAAVQGVTQVIDDSLNVSVTADLNKLPQVQFATASATILEASYPDLDAAAELLIAAGDDVRIEVQGYTDVRGDDAYNLGLSQDRTDSVRTYLIDKGVNADVLTAKGYGETTEFAEGDTPEAYAANRLVRFDEIG